MGNVIARIPLTGGPKGGKTTIKEEIKRMLEEEYGYKVFLVQETATEIIKSGFIPTAKPKDGNKKEMDQFERTNIAFQQMILDLQIAKEKAFELAAQAEEKDVVIIYDRGIMDNKGYLIKNLGEKGRITFEMMIDRYHLTEEEIMNRYDAVISLGSSVRITKFDDQSIDNTTKRIESGEEEAIEVDNNVDSVWKSHQKYIRIEAAENFEEKVNTVLNTIRNIIENKKGQKLTKKINQEKSR